MKKSTLEEVAERYRLQTLDESYSEKLSFIKGAKWQEKQMYSDEEVLKLLLNIKRVNIYYEDVEKWFGQFKKK